MRYSEYAAQLEENTSLVMGESAENSAELQRALWSRARSVICGDDFVVMFRLEVLICELAAT